MSNEDRWIDYDDALARAFAKVERAKADGLDQNIKKDGKARRYITLASVDQAARDALTAEGFSYPQLPTTTQREDGSLWLTVTTRLRRKGLEIVGELGLPVHGQMLAGGQGFKPATAQSVGSAITYGRRYALTALLGVCPDDDDDGHGASKGTHEPAPDPLWDAFVDKRGEVATAYKEGIPQAFTRMVAAASMNVGPNDPLGPDQLRALTAVGDALVVAAREPTKPKARGKAKAAEQDPRAQAYALWTEAGKALLAHRGQDYQDAEGQEAPADTVDLWRAEILRLSAQACGLERFSAREATAEHLTLAADALGQDLERRKAVGS